MLSNEEALWLIYKQSSAT